MKPKNDYEPMAPENPVNSTLFFKDILGRLKIDLNSPEHVLANQWEAIVGENLAHTSKFCSIENNVLKVKCTNACAASLFRMNSSEIIKKVNSIFPEININKINVRV